MKYLKEKAMPALTGLSAVALSACLSGCNNMDLLDPKGSVGIAEKHLIATSVWVMLIVVLPVIFLTLYFAWRYRATNAEAEYAPGWSHSIAIEVVIWTVPALIILYLGILTWNSTHELDPYKPLESQVKPIRVQVVALDWKWMFIYPDLGIATVNQLAMPVNTPVNFQITSDAVMNSFFIPQLGSQVYAMAGMKTRVHLMAEQTGDYAGLSANFSGRGFSDMKFRTLAMSSQDFAAWVQKVRAASQPLDMNVYRAVAAPSEKNPVRYFSTVNGNLFDEIVAKYNVGGMDGMAGMNMPAHAASPRG